METKFKFCKSLGCTNKTLNTDEVCDSCKSWKKRYGQTERTEVKSQLKEEKNSAVSPEIPERIKISAIKIEEKNMPQIKNINYNHLLNQGRSTMQTEITTMQNEQQTEETMPPEKMPELGFGIEKMPEYKEKESMQTDTKETLSLESKNLLMTLQMGNASGKTLLDDSIVHMHKLMKSVYIPKERTLSNMSQVLEVVEANNTNVTNIKTAVLCAKEFRSLLKLKLDIHGLVITR